MFCNRRSHGTKPAILGEERLIIPAMGNPNHKEKSSLNARSHFVSKSITTFLPLAWRSLYLAIDRLVQKAYCANLPIVSVKRARPSVKYNTDEK